MDFFLNSECHLGILVCYLHFYLEQNSIKSRFAWKELSSVGTNWSNPNI